MKLNSLAFRLFATAMAWTLIALPIVGFTIYSLNSKLIMDNFDERLRQLVWVIQQESINEGREPLKPKNVFEPLFGIVESGWYWQIKPVVPSGNATLKSDSLATADLPLLSKAAIGRSDGIRRWHDTTGPKGQPLRVVELVGTVSEDKDAPEYAFTVAGPLDWPHATINEFATVLAIALALTGLALLVATFFQVRVALKSLSAIERGLSDIRSGEAERLAGEFPSEIEPLQAELNALMESNEDIIERARTQVGNLAHALKTPLAVLTNEADRFETPLARKVSEQTQVMRNQVDHYLDRARMAARANSIGRVTSVLPVVEGLKRALERIHLDRNIRISIECDPRIAFRGEKQDLEELLGNLLDNASKWATASVRLRAAVEHTPAGHKLRITIEDDGEGVPEAQRATMMKRGQRLDESKPGSGLGLSIVRDLVTSYRGQLRLSQSDMGGLMVDLMLPAVNS